MSKPKLTPWFDGRVRPVRDGVYEVVWCTEIVHAKFKGGRWYRGSFNGIDEASKSTETFGIFQTVLRWRGAAEDQTKGKKP